MLIRVNCYLCNMYIPEAFRVTDDVTIRTFLNEHPFGILSVNGYDGMPLMAHLPFLVVDMPGGKWGIEGHMAVENPLVAFVRPGQQAVMTVSGAHGYVSSSLYGHVNVPTYNYQAVQLRGTFTQLSPMELLGHLEKVVHAFEKNRRQPLDFTHFPQEMLNAYLKEIVGFRLEVFDAEAAFKLSQNRNDKDFRSIVNDLEQGLPEEVRLAGEMLKYRK